MYTLATHLKCNILFNMKMLSDYYVLKIDSDVKKKEITNNLLESAIKFINVA